MMKLKTMFLGIAILIPLSIPALTALPMKVSVQTGDTLSFTPILKDWDSTVTTVAVEFTPPLHGTVRFIPDWFDSNGYYRSVMSRARTAPPLFPGIRYIPNSGFMGRDSFTYRILTSADTTETVRCAVRVAPPEPGNMTVLLVVNSGLYPSIQPEVERLRDDLIREGFAPRIIPWTVPGTWTVTNAREVWDTLVAEYDNPARMLAGAILIGQLPYYSTGTTSTGIITKESAYWCMSLWEADMDADTAINGLRVNISTYGGVHYTPGYMNIWVSHMSGANLPKLGTETELVKRMLQTNHDYRTGISRLPQTASCYFMNITGIAPEKFLAVWPEFNQHMPRDTVSPLISDYKRGGELWQMTVHNHGAGYQAVYKTLSGFISWEYAPSDSFYNTMFPFRFFLANCCVIGGFGKFTHQHMLTRNSGCVMATGHTDYYGGLGCLNLANTLTTDNRDTRILTCLSKGNRWGEAILRGRGHIWSHVFHGDLSLKPKMGPANRKPVISSLNAVKESGLSWTFTVTASDTDDGIMAYDWYGRSYNLGKAAPDSVGPSPTFSITYPSALLCTLRVEALDHYKARDYAEVILKTDSGIVSTRVFTRNETPAMQTGLKQRLSIQPNPFNPGTLIRLGSLVSGKNPITLEVLRPDSRSLHFERFSPSCRAVSWNGKDDAGRDAGSGVYLFRIREGARTWMLKGALIR